MGWTIQDLLDKFKDRPAEELKAYLEGYNQAYVDISIEKQKRQKETLDTLRRYNMISRIQNTSSNEPNSKGEDI